MDGVLTGVVVLDLAGFEGVSSLVRYPVRLFVAISNGETACYNRLAFA